MSIKLDSEDFKRTVAELQEKVPYDEVVIGCFLCNYGDNQICGAFRSRGCKDAARCQHLAKITRIYNEQTRTVT